jgi:tetratricopeptide (TPR) repeat protein
MPLATRSENDTIGTAVREVETMLERTARHYPRDLAPHHYARRTGWHLELRRLGGSFVRCAPEEFDRLTPLARHIEANRCLAEARLVSERLNDVILGSAEREALIVRALGILPAAESERLAEICSCRELHPRRIARNAESTIAAVEQVAAEFGSATSLVYGMLVLAGMRSDDELLRYTGRLDRLFARVVSAPSVITALNQPLPSDPDMQFNALFPTLLAVREELWRIRPNRVSQEFLLTQVIDGYLGERPGGGNSLGLALVDSIVIGKLGFPATCQIENDVMSLQVTVGTRHVYWDLTKPSPLSFVSVTGGRTLDTRDLFAVAYGSLAAMCFTRSMWDKAIDSYNRELEIEPGSVSARTSLAVCFLRKQQPNDAIKTLKLALEADPASPEAHHQLGNAYAMMSNWSRAIDAFKKALHLRPDYVEVYNNLGFAYMRAENPTQAVAAFEAAIERRPDYHQAYYNLGNLYLEHGDFAKAIKCYRDTVKLEPKLVGAHYNLGRAYYDKGDIDSAIQSYQKAVQLNPKHFGAWHNLGIAYRDKGQTDKAVEALEKAVTINPNLMR